MSARPHRVALTVVATMITACVHAGGATVTDTSGPAAMAGDSLRFTATTRIRADSLVVDVVARNATQRALSLEWGACALDVQLFRAAALEGTPAFDYGKSRDPGTPPGTFEACPLYLRTQQLAPGDTLAPDEFHRAMALRRLGADSLGAGTYHVAARLLGVVVPAGTIELR